jgi:hypothetical protein
MRSTYPHRRHRKRLRHAAEAMMEQHTRWQQLDLLVLATNAIQRRQLDPMIRSDVTGLLKLLLNECSAANAKAKEADDE